MKVTIIAAGSVGDIQPCVVLGKGLQRSGFRVTLAAPVDFADLINENDLDFYPMRGDVQRIMAGETGRQFMERGGANPIGSIRAIRKMVGPVILPMIEDAYEACSAADAVICLGVFGAFGQSIAEARHIPIFHIEPTPLLPTRDFPAPSWPIQRNLGGIHNYLSGQAMLRVIWLWYRPYVQQFRIRLGLVPSSFDRFLSAFRSTPMLSAYSPSIIPRPADWPVTFHVTGYLFLDDAAAWRPPPELIDFLDSGPPPIYFGFGSMAGRQPQRLARCIIEALDAIGRRGVLLTGWGGLRPESLPDHVFLLDYAPHGWLFPRMAAVVHHGGAGTTAAGLRAGVPTVTVPFVLDQPFWGARIKQLGLGPAPIPQQKLTADKLAGALKTALDPAITRRARVIGAAIRAEKGAAKAVEIVEQYLGQPSAAKVYS
ncbi:MAG: glycosyltransferase [Candidatus Promineifilaceae bacterium]|nr:glycosyltransferase [Candidatus Promineifilaceae bacterium]